MVANDLRFTFNVRVVTDEENCKSLHVCQLKFIRFFANSFLLFPKTSRNTCESPDWWKIMDWNVHWMNCLKRENVIDSTDVFDKKASIRCQIRITHAFMPENFDWKLNKFFKLGIRSRSVCRWWRLKYMKYVIFRIWFGCCCCHRRRQFVFFTAHSLNHVQVAGSSSSIYSNPMAICKLAYTFLYNRVLLLLLFSIFILSEFVKWLPNAIRSKSRYAATTATTTSTTARRLKPNTSNKSKWHIPYA